MNMIELFNSLKRGETERLYLFHGPEELLKREAVDKIKDILVPASLEQLNLTVIDGSAAAADTIINAVETLPFMNPRRLVIVNNAVFGPAGKRAFTQSDMDILEKYLSRIPQHSCLVITTKNSPDMRTRLMKTFKAQGNMVEFGRLKPQLLEKWVAKQFDSNGKVLSPLVLKKFIGLTGYFDRNSDKTLDHIANEIEKVVKYCQGKNEIQQSEIEALAPRHLDMDIFKLVDAVGYKNISKAIELLEDMKQGGEPPLRVLFMVVRQFRLLLQASVLRDTGYSSKAVASKIKLPPFVVGSLLKQADNFTEKDLRNALKECGQLEANVKSGRMEPWLALELLIAGL